MKIDLAAFNQSDKMMNIRNILQASTNEGNLSTVISFESLGTSLEAIMIITLLEEHGAKVEYGNNIIIVKGWTNV